MWQESSMPDSRHSAISPARTSTEQSSNQQSSTSMSNPTESTSSSHVRSNLSRQGTISRTGGADVSYESGSTSSLNEPAQAATPTYSSRGAPRSGTTRPPLSSKTSSPASSTLHTLPDTTTTSAIKWHHPVHPQIRPTLFQSVSSRASSSQNPRNPSSFSDPLTSTSLPQSSTLLEFLAHHAHTSPNVDDEDIDELAIVPAPKKISMNALDGYPSGGGPSHEHSASTSIESRWKGKGRALSDNEDGESNQGRRSMVKDPPLLNLFDKQERTSTDDGSMPDAKLKLTELSLQTLEAERETLSNQMEMARMIKSAAEHSAKEAERTLAKAQARFDRYLLSRWKKKEVTAEGKSGAATIEVSAADQIRGGTPAASASENSLEGFRAKRERERKERQLPAGVPSMRRTSTVSFNAPNSSCSDPSASSSRESPTSSSLTKCTDDSANRPDVPSDEPATASDSIRQPPVPPGAAGERRQMLRAKQMLLSGGSRRSQSAQQLLGFSTTMSQRPPANMDVDPHRTDPSPSRQEPNERTVTYRIQPKANELATGKVSSSSNSHDASHPQEATTSILSEGGGTNREAQLASRADNISLPTLAAKSAGAMSWLRDSTNLSHQSAPVPRALVIDPSTVPRHRKLASTCRKSTGGQSNARLNSFSQLSGAGAAAANQDDNPSAPLRSSKPGLPDASASTSNNQHPASHPSTDGFSGADTNWPHVEARQDKSGASEEPTETEAESLAAMQLDQSEEKPLVNKDTSEEDELETDNDQPRLIAPLPARAHPSTDRLINQVNDDEELYRQEF
ncbi:hypothetical protein BT69DRAFT_174120 [Atractiella rhizophila]|nr:hypothetical protein BT69DRAFT_174120 [Atractiella rhizophila]